MLQCFAHLTLGRKQLRMLCDLNYSSCFLFVSDNGVMFPADIDKVERVHQVANKDALYRKDADMQRM